MNNLVGIWDRALSSEWQQCLAHGREKREGGDWCWVITETLY